MTGPVNVGIAIEDLEVAFGATKVLKGVDLEIQPGEFFAFLGPSGSGKSTLLRAIAGFGPRPTGRIRIGGDDVTHLPPWKRNVGMVFQNYALWPHMTVRRNVAFGLEEQRAPKREIEERVAAALDLVGLGDLADRRPSQLSGGQQQRVALARTIVVEPRILLLDEPLSNLDANLRVKMRRDIHKLQRKLGLTTIFVTHDQEEANTLADRMAVLEDGVIQQVGAPTELYDNPANLFVANFLGTANVIGGRVEAGEETACFRADDGLVIPLDGGERAGPGSLVFRPQNLVIQKQTDAPPDARARLDGEVDDFEFLGGLIRYAVRVGAHTVLVDRPHQAGELAFERGDRVALYLAAKQARILGQSES